jgi:hypothetical protein
VKILNCCVDRANLPRGLRNFGTLHPRLRARRPSEQSLASRVDLVIVRAFGKHAPFRDVNPGPRGSARLRRRVWQLFHQFACRSHVGLRRKCQRIIRECRSRRWPLEPGWIGIRGSRRAQRWPNERYLFRSGTCSAASVDTYAGPLPQSRIPR